MRKLRLGDGAVVKDYIDELRAVATALGAHADLADMAPGLREGIDTLEQATDWLQAHMGVEARAVAAGSTPYINLFGTVAGAVSLAKLALAAAEETSGDWDEAFLKGRAVLARFFIRQLLPPALGLLAGATAGAEDLFALDASAL